jgi:hypothetical protein
MITFFPLAFSVWSSRISSFGLFNLRVFIGKELWSTCVAWKVKRPY